MLRAQVLRRAFSLYNRVPHSRIAQSAAQEGHATVTVQRFRISRPFFSNNRLVGALAILSTVWYLTKDIRIQVEVNVENEDENGQDPTSPGDKGDADDDDGEDVLLFLPTGFSRPARTSFYKGSDPEWQEFRKLAADKPRIDRIRNELTLTMRRLADKNANWTFRLGKIDTSKGGSWIELKFPDSPPVEFERPGIALTEDLEWRKATRQVEELDHLRLRRFLLPREISNALYADIKHRAHLAWKSFKSSVGFKEKPRPTPQPGSIQEKVAQFKARNRERAENTGLPVATVAGPPAATGINSTGPTDPASSMNSQQATELGFVLPDLKNLTIDLSKFQQEVRRTLKPHALQPSRGNVLVLGLIEIYGERARITLNVAAAYDPKLGKYTAIRASIWNLVDLNQSPRGGP